MLFLAWQKNLQITGVSLLFTVECICKDILQQYYQIFSGAGTAVGNKLTDVLSTADPIVIFFSNSWLTERGMYSRYTETFVPADGVSMSEEEKNVYVENIKYIVNSRLKLGQLIIENDYYRQALE